MNIDIDSRPDMTFRVNPKNVSKVFRYLGEKAEQLKEKIGKWLVTIHLGKFTAGQLREMFIANPDIVVQGDVGTKLRAKGVLLNGSSPESIGNETSINIDKGDVVLIVPESKRDQADTNNGKCVIINRDVKIEIGEEIVFGDGNVVLERIEGFTFYVKETNRDIPAKKGKQAKIFADHGITEPAHLNNKGDKLFAPEDLAALDVLAEYADQVSDIVISFISRASHVVELHKTINEKFERFGKAFPKITYKIEMLEAIKNLRGMLDKSKELGFTPNIVIGCGDLESQVKESLGKDASKEEISKQLEKEIEKIVKTVSKYGIKELSIAWGLGEDSDTTEKLRKIIVLEKKYKVNINYWVTKATIGKSEGADVVKVLEGIASQRTEVIESLLLNVASEVAKEGI